MGDHWTQDASLRFIEMYKSRPVLWNPEDDEYYNKAAKAHAWQEIADGMESTTTNCHRKMVSLLSSYRRERAKEQKVLRLTGKPYRPRWFAYESLNFLTKRKRRKAENGEDEEVHESDNYEETESLNSTDARDEIEEFDLVPQLKIKSEEKPSLNPLELETPTNSKRQKSDCTDNIAINIQALESNQDSNEECYSFGNFVSSKMRHYSWKTRCSVQHEISNILYKADMGMYEENFALDHDDLKKYFCGFF